MKKNFAFPTLIFYLSTFVLIVIISYAGSAQPKASGAFTSFEKAKRLLDTAIQAHGGLENLRSADKVTINYKAFNYSLGQSYSFTAQLRPTPRDGAKTLIDYSRSIYVSEGQTNFQGGYKFNFRTVISPKRSFSIDLLKNRRGDEVRTINEPQKTQQKIGMLAEIPHLLLLYVRQRLEALRYLGETEVDGRRLHGVAFAAETGAQMSLYFDVHSGLLARIEQIASHEQLGDVTNAIVFSDYRAVGGVKVPGRRTSLTDQFVTSENEYADVRLDFADGEKLLEIPTGFVEAAGPTAAPASPPAKKMGDGVYLMEQFGYRVMFAEFDDHVVVLEAPTSSEIAKAEIQIIKRLVPNKPIKYVTFSHFHFDHTGGLREYIAEGATVVVPAGNKAFVEQISRSKFSIRPDRLALEPRAPAIEILDKKRVFTDGKRTLELYSIGPTSHAEEMVMFYFPKEKILFQGDMFSPLDQGGIPPIIEVHHELVKKVRDLKLDVETLIGVHSGAIAWKDLVVAVDRSGR